MGSWWAQNCLEFDTAWPDIFTPFSNRKLLMDMLAVDERFRKGPKYELYRHLIMKMWPAIFSYPINPKKRTKALIGTLKRISNPLKRLYRG